MAYIFHRRSGLLGILAALTLTPIAMAQTAATPTASTPDTAVPVAETAAQVKATPPQNAGPTFWLFGVPIRPSAPVPPPYEGTAYNDLGGQPMTSVDQVMSQQFTDQQK
jgi:hypothetical protein